jgi:hypothetical protein
VLVGRWDVMDDEEVAVQLGQEESRVFNMRNFLSKVLVIFLIIIPQSLMFSTRVLMGLEMHVRETKMIYLEN